MKRRIDLTDPNCEPTDEELKELFTEMMVGVKERRKAADAELAETIRKQSEAVRKEWLPRMEALRA